VIPARHNRHTPLSRLYHAAGDGAVEGTNLTGSTEEAEVQRQDRDQRDRLDAALADREARVRILESHLAGALRRLADYERILGRRPLRAVLHAKEVAGSLAVRASPPASRRAQVVRRARTLVAIIRSEGVGAALQRVRDRARHQRAAVSQSTPADEQYRRWLQHHDPSPEQLGEMRRQNERWAYRPLISVVVPVYNTDRRLLDAMVASVRSQVYDNWELCLADDLSPAPQVRPALSQWAEEDARIKVAFREENGNIAAASNTGLELATGEFVALLDHDDVLRPHALHRVVEVLQEGRDIDLVYSDEDKILFGGLRGHVHFKGDFDPDYLLSTNYISHLSVIRRDTITAVGGFRVGLDGSQDHDLVLRVSERARRVRHVADVLYSWRQVPGSAAIEGSEKPAAWDAGRRAVDDALLRRESGGNAELGPTSGLYVARYSIPAALRVTVVVMASDTATTITSLGALRGAPGVSPDRWIVCGHDGALRAVSDATVDVVVTPGSAHRSRLINELLAGDDSDVLVFVAGDLQPANANDAWLDPLVEQAARTSVGAVGGQITGREENEGALGQQDGGPHLVETVGVRWPVIQQVCAVSIDCMAVRRATLAVVGGFDERYRVSFHDIDLCLRLRQAGLAVVYSPLTAMRRLRPWLHETPASDDAGEFRDAWEGRPEWTDPFLSPWLERVTPFVVRDS
jgi:O-antigen biosynthesis protein